MYDAIVVAGGAGRRMGGVAKPQLTLAGRTLLDHVVGAVVGAGRVVVVGPVQPVTGEVVFCREEPPGGGPVAAVAAGFPHTAADLVAVLAADLPRIGGALAPLRAAVPADGVALLTDASGRANYLAAVWRRAALAAALDRIGAVSGASMRALLAGVPAAALPDTGDWGRDCDTRQDLDELAGLERRDRDAPAHPEGPACPTY